MLSLPHFTERIFLSQCFSWSTTEAFVLYALERAHAHTSRTSFFYFGLLLIIFSYIIPRRNFWIFRKLCPIDSVRKWFHKCFVRIYIAVQCYLFCMCYSIENDHFGHHFKQSVQSTRIVLCLPQLGPPVLASPPLHLSSHISCAQKANLQAYNNHSIRFYSFFDYYSEFFFSLPLSLPFPLTSSSPFCRLGLNVFSSHSECDGKNFMSFVRCICSFIRIVQSTSIVPFSGYKQKYQREK